MKIGVIGTGTIASAVIAGIAKNAHEITVSTRNAENARRLADTFANVSVAENQQVIDSSDLIFLGTTAEVAPSVLNNLTFRPDQTVISFMVGLSVAQIQELIAPAVFDATMIPFPSIAKGNSPILTCPGSDLVETLFGSTNSVFAFDTPEQMEVYLTVQAVLSPALKLIDTAAEWMSARSDDPEGADRFLRLLVGGTLNSGPVSAAIADLNTPGGLNATLREHLAEHGGYAALRDGLDMLEQRLQRER